MFTTVGVPIEFLPIIESQLEFPKSSRNTISGIQFQSVCFLTRVTKDKHKQKEENDKRNTTTT
jgi:hypothetical protein